VPREEEWFAVRRGGDDGRWGVVRRGAARARPWFRARRSRDRLVTFGDAVPWPGFPGFDRFHLFLVNWSVKFKFLKNLK
jgi:hypothetical protein